MEANDSPFIPYRLELRRTVGGASVEALLRSAQVRPLPAKFVYLVHGATGLPFQPFLEYAAQTMLTRSQAKPALSKSLLTVDAYASDLCDYFSFLDAEKLRWEEADEVDAYAYIDSMIEHPSPVTGEPYKDETIRRRLSSLRSYYSWAQTRGRARTNLKLVDPGECLKARRYEGGPGDAKGPSPAAADRKVRPIPPAELQILMQSLGPQMEPRGQGDTGPQAATARRNRLFGECAYHIGLRRAEIAALQARHIMGLSVDAASPYVLHPVEVFGKGAKWRTVNIPAWLLDALQRYHDVHRAPAVAGQPTHDHLFVSHSASRCGRPLSAKHLDDIFANACLRAGLSHSANPELARYKLHHLRHNFALATYFSRKANGDAEPWLYIQAMLGHEYLETTLRIYLRAAKALESTYADYFSKALKEMVANA